MLVVPAAPACCGSLRCCCPAWVYSGGRIDRHTNRIDHTSIAYISSPDELIKMFYPITTKSSAFKNDDIYFLLVYLSILFSASKEPA